MKAFSGRLYKLRWASLPLCFCSLVFLDLAFRSFYGHISAEPPFSPHSLLFTAGWSLIFTALIAQLPRLGRRVAMAVVFVFFALLAVTHGVMLNLFGHAFTLADLSFAGDGAKFFSWTYFRLRRAFLLCVALAAALMALAVVLAQPPKSGRLGWKPRLIALALLAAGALTVGITHGKMLPRVGNMWWGATYVPGSRQEAYKDFTDPNRCLQLSGLYQYTARDLSVSLGWETDRQSLERLDEYYARRGEETGEITGMTGALEGKDLIMVMLESVDTWMVTEEIMPRLYALQQESVNFTRFYTPLFLKAGTFNTEIISQTGMIPAVSGLPTSAYSSNAFPYALGALFEKKGYTANSFHSASPDIYSRGSIHTNLGFEKYHCSGDMDMDDYQLDSQMINGYPLMVPQGRFFTYIITYSGHGPYTLEMRSISDPHAEAAQAVAARSGVTGSPEDLQEYALAIAHAMETDAFVGALLDRLEADGRLNDTALLFYADHYGKYMSSDEFLGRLKGVPADSFELYRTPCFLYAPGLAPQNVEKPASPADLPPTVAGLFKLDTDGRYYAGSDLFAGGEGLVLFPNYEWLDSDGYWTSQRQSGGDEAVKEKAKLVRERINACADTLKTDYFKGAE